LELPTKAVHNLEIPEFDPATGEGAVDDGRVECEVCARKFKMDRIAKHQLICRKVTRNEIVRKRKTKAVDGETLRLKGTDFEQYKDRRTEVSHRAVLSCVLAAAYAVFQHLACVHALCGAGLAPRRWSGCHGGVRSTSASKPSRQLPRRPR
jgi:hypothetical protein